MSNVIKIKVATSIFFRLLGAGSKFIFFIYLAKKSSEILGELGLIFAVIAIGVQFAGAEVHNINSREIAIASRQKISALINAQLRLHFLFYLLVIPMLAILSYFKFVDWGYFFWIAILLLSEHLAQELTRVLLFLYKPEISALIIFIKGGLWIFILIVIVDFYGASLTALLAVKIWLLFSILSVLVGAFAIKNYLFCSEYLNIFNTNWVKKILKKTFPFLVAATCFTLAQYVDRFVLERFTGATGVGIYLFFASLASALYLMVSFSVGVFYQPLAVKAFQQGGLLEYKKVKAIFIKKTILFGVAWGFLALVSIHPLLLLIDKSEYFRYESVYYVSVLVNIILIISDFKNLDLYVRGMDSEIMWTTITGLIIATLIQILLVWLFGILGSAFGALLSALFLWYQRNSFYRDAILRTPELLLKPRLT